MLSMRSSAYERIAYSSQIGYSRFTLGFLGRWIQIQGPKSLENKEKPLNQQKLPFLLVFCKILELKLKLSK